ncbi:MULTISPECIES: hypothetical protein [Lysinibacillus]|jgi:GMP synthase (glutamine-hydrolysing)|uniref:GMP synthase (glutamine-hydrolyzing) n=1 Tax=Lysinibacillus TaxID=400634 RepID=UPI0009DE0800|nr:hypothetical protein [Lysinibacillus fusiformis]
MYLVLFCVQIVRFIIGIEFFIDIKSNQIGFNRHINLHVIGIRAVTSIDGKTSDWARITWAVLDKISVRLILLLSY